MDIEKLLAANPAMTDIHLTEGLPLMIRVYGALKKMKEIAEPQLFAELISSYVPEDRQAAYQRTGSADSAFSLGNVRCRLHLYRSGGLASAAIRILPELSLLGADPDRTWLEKVSQLSHGLVLITGSSGSGKSTTMARILSLISQKRACHVVTLEDPVEYVIPMEKALIHQREIGRDVADFPQGIRDALREDPDVIALGEMRDSETISAALTAAGFTIPHRGSVTIGHLKPGQTLTVSEEALADYETSFADGTAVTQGGQWTGTVGQSDTALTCRNNKDGVPPTGLRRDAAPALAAVAAALVCALLRRRREV